MLTKKQLDRLGDRKRAPCCIISRNEAIMTGIDLRPASAHMEPGCYKLDRDFVLDTRREVRKGTLTDSSSAPSFPFVGDGRIASDGTVRSLVHPENRWVNPLSPGQYEEVDSVVQPQRVRHPSVPAWSMTRSHRPLETGCLHGNPAPGTYEAPSHFDSISRSRQRAFDRLVRRTKRCQWEQEFSTIFRSMHASATQAQNPKVGLA